MSDRTSTTGKEVMVPDFRRLSPRDRKLLVVVHAHAGGRDHALRNATIALENDADGIFLIGHDPRLDHTRLAGICDFVYDELGDPWIGVNFLDLAEPMAALEYALTTCASGLWVDNARLVADKVRQPRPRAVMKKLTALGDEAPQYFGGVAFKYQPDEGDPVDLAALAGNYMDVVTTSGSATGKPVEIDKVRRMKAAMPHDLPLAVASGVSAANVWEILPHVTFFLVASSLCKSAEEPDELDPAKVRQLADIIHGWAD